MNRSELIELLAKQSGLPFPVVEAAVGVLHQSMQDTLVEGGRIEIRGFGSFVVKNYEGYTGRNPKSGEPTHVPPKKLPFFKVGKDLKERIDTIEAKDGEH